jgi:hypothetical protein
MMLLIWAVLLELVGSSSTQLVIVRLVTFAVALAVSLHELAGRRRERRS